MCFSSLISVPTLDEVFGDFQDGDVVTAEMNDYLDKYHSFHMSNEGSLAGHQKECSLPSRNRKNPNGSTPQYFYMLSNAGVNFSGGVFQHMAVRATASLRMQQMQGK